MKHRYLLAGIAAATALMLSACGGEAISAADLDPAGLGDSSVQSQMAELYSQAQSAKQDSVVVYGPGEVLYAGAYDKFMQRYPDIKVTGEYIYGAELASRLDQEFTSGKHVGSLQTGGAAMTVASVNANRCEPFEPFTGKDIKYLTSDAVGADNTYRAVVGYPFGIAYNKDVAGNNPPKSWADLADPKWSGKFVMEDPRIVNGTSQTVAQLLNGKYFDESWLQNVANNNPQIRGNSALAVQAVSTGQVAFDAFAQYAQYYPSIRDGEPIGFVFPTAGAARMEYHFSCMLKDGPNASATELLYNWLLTPEGQKALSESGVYGVLEGTPAPQGLPALSEVEGQLITPSKIVDANDVTKAGIAVAKKLFK